MRAVLAGAQRRRRLHGQRRLLQHGAYYPRYTVNTTYTVACDSSRPGFLGPSIFDSFARSFCPSLVVCAAPPGLDADARGDRVGRSPELQRHPRHPGGALQAAGGARGGGGRAGEKAAELAQKLGQLQPFIDVFPQECTGQLAFFGPT